MKFASVVLILTAAIMAAAMPNFALLARGPFPFFLAAIAPEAEAEAVAAMPISNDRDAEIEFTEWSDVEKQKQKRQLPICEWSKSSARCRRPFKTGGFYDNWCCRK
ncbi:hypothetical protein FPQ18DRAFT_393042 [Pyronema domesticum]|nr:hypothetical protein FPQ18DRAFT_393042 [Pyronema domesticum]